MLLRLLFIVLLLASAPLSAQDLVQVSDPWIRAMPPQMPMTAAFMTVRNLTDQPLTLAAVESTVFGRIEMHRTEIDAQGVARMLAQKNFAIPPKGELSLAPKGNHLMLYDPRQPLQIDSRLPLTLVFADGARVPVQAVVRQGMGDDADHTHHH